MLYDSEKLLIDNGYRVGLASVLAKDTNQSRLKDYSGLYAIDDPNDDDQGFCLRGDSRSEIVREAMQHFEGFLK